MHSVVYLWEQFQHRSDIALVEQGILMHRQCTLLRNSYLYQDLEIESHILDRAALRLLNMQLGNPMEVTKFNSILEF